MSRKSLANGERAALLQKPTTVPLDTCRAILRAHHEDLRRYLNLHEITPLLNKHNLTLEVDLAHFADTRFSLENRVDMLVDGLIKSNQENVLLLFIDCLRESADSAGKPHTELADAIQEHYFKELERCRREGKKGFCMSHIGKVLMVVTVAAFIIFAVLISVYVGMVSKAPQVKRFPILDGEGTFTVTSVVENKWIGAIKLSLEKFDIGNSDTSTDHYCEVQAAVVDDKSCPELSQVVKKENLNEWTDILYLLAHPGSKLMANVSKETDYHLWITRNLDEYDRLNDQLKNNKDTSMHCDDFPHSCFKAKDYIGQVITYYVNATSYYSYVLTNSMDSCLSDEIFPEEIEFSYQLVSINYTSITSNSTYYKFIEPIKYMYYGSTPVELNLHSEFNFHETCPLVHFICHCTFLSPHCFQVLLTGIKPRTEFLAFMTTGAGVILLSLVLISVLVCFYRHSQNKFRL